MSAGIVSATGLSSKDGAILRSEAGDERAATVGSTDRIVHVSAGYLDALGVPAVQGRMLTPDEYRDQHQVALVNEEAVRRWWPGSTGVVGSQIKLGANPWATVVGVVRNTGPLTVELLASDPAARIFLPIAGIRGSVLLFARTAGDPLAMLPTLHARTLAVDRRIRIQMPEEVNAKIDWEIAGHRETATFVGGLAAFGLLLAAMGVYGVTTYAVARRMREIGIRKALGGSPGHIVLTVSRETAGLTLGGIVIGLAASAGVTRMLGAMLFGTSPLDASVFIGASLLILAIVALATWAPMRTALKVDPMTTLRCE